MWWETAGALDSYMVDQNPPDEDYFYFANEGADAAPIASPSYGMIFVTTAIPGDTDGDGDVDINDLSTLAANWDQCGKTWADGDFTGDGCVDINDLSLLASNWGAGTAAAQVPEPATLSVLALGGLAMLRRRRR